MFADDGERARIAVTKAIRRSIARVTAADPVIGAELDKRVQTGKAVLLQRVVTALPVTRGWNGTERQCHAWSG